MMSRLTRDGTAEPVSRDQKFSGANGDREILFFPIQLTTTNVIGADIFTGGKGILLSGFEKLENVSKIQNSITI